jgi:hypothetical protein
MIEKLSPDRFNGFSNQDVGEKINEIIDTINTELSLNQVKQNTNTIKLDGQLEIDVDRGVLYFHSNVTGTSTLRICGLNIPSKFLANKIDSIDIAIVNDKDKIMYNCG